MGKLSNNIKFYTFINILSIYSDENKSLSIKEINSHMEEKLGVILDRRTIYGYIKDMRVLGLPVSEYDKNKEGYYLKSHLLEEQEVQTLIDIIKSSKFITKKKTQEILEKIAKLSTIYRGRIVSSDVYVDDTSKTSNEEIFNNISLLRTGIMENKKVTFNYSHSNNNEIIKCKVNPICLVLSNDEYYLISLDDINEEITNYKLNQMLNLEVTNEENKSYKTIIDSEDEFNLDVYIKSVIR